MQSKEWCEPARCGEVSASTQPRYGQPRHGQPRAQHNQKTRDIVSYCVGAASRPTSHRPTSQTHATGPVCRYEVIAWCLAVRAQACLTTFRRRRALFASSVHRVGRLRGDGEATHAHWALCGVCVCVIIKAASPCCRNRGVLSGTITAATAFCMQAQLKAAVTHVSSYQTLAPCCLPNTRLKMQPYHCMFFSLELYSAATMHGGACNWLL
jgi:hypothetical protein